MNRRVGRTLGALLLLALASSVLFLLSHAVVGRGTDAPPPLAVPTPDGGVGVVARGALADVTPAPTRRHGAHDVGVTNGTHRDARGGDEGPAAAVAPATSVAAAGPAPVRVAPAPATTTERATMTQGEVPVETVPTSSTALADTAAAAAAATATARAWAAAKAAAEAGAPAERLVIPDAPYLRYWEADRAPWSPRALAALAAVACGPLPDASPVALGDAPCAAPWTSEVQTRLWAWQHPARCEDKKVRVCASEMYWRVLTRWIHTRVRCSSSWCR